VPFGAQGRSLGPIDVVSYQGDELERPVERVGDHRQVVDGHGDSELAFDLGEDERCAWNRRAVERGEPQDRRLVVDTRLSDRDCGRVERGHAIKTDAVWV